VRQRNARAIVFSSAEFIFLLGLWMLFVSMVKVDELLVGLCAAIISAVADGVVKAKQFAKFRPRLQWLLMFFWEPWYILEGSASILWALVRRLMGKKSEAQFRVVPFRAGGETQQDSARRALAVTLTTIPPNFIVVGIDKERNFMLVHQVSPTGTPEVTQRLGATG
jgi:multisubunit Na+/H+ antiporter MnhE subunit